MEERRFTLKLLESEQMLYRIACAFLRSEADRRDAMQETALKAWQYRDRLREEHPEMVYCDFIQEQITGREDEFEYINIGEHIRYLSAFMRLRDTNPVFDRMKEIGDVGVPAFVFEDGRVSIDPADAGLVEYGSANACSVEDHKSGRKGC